MMSSVATINIKNLRLRTFIGIKDEEINNQQDVLINASIRYDASKAISENCIEAALNYRTITKQIIKLVEDNRFALLERMTHEILSIIMDYQDVVDATVEIDKPYALRYADSVSVTLTATRKVI
ncbi:dihydroneopterin triphosphate 2'-epimerase [Alkalimarinus alittae]|uniref:Dihydroneopterin triphosphate 2'-epimerase n=2 Tax=Alkalimarinus alittae TaxID=2961619 RepID=A0ABY6N7A0_9ALTE|nr:dihydroneopterin triphosphate 2'-epimerase [Alkalimarinus alittae]